MLLVRSIGKARDRMKIKISANILKQILPVCRLHCTIDTCDTDSCFYDCTHSATQRLGWHYTVEAHNCIEAFSGNHIWSRSTTASEGLSCRTIWPESLSNAMEVAIDNDTQVETSYV